MMTFDDEQVGTPDTGPAAPEAPAEMPAAPEGDSNDMGGDADTSEGGVS